MTHSSTKRTDVKPGDTVRDAMIAGWAYQAGIDRGIALGAVMALTPDEKNRDAYRAGQHAKRLAASTPPVREPSRFWPAEMPGGWPLPPEIPPDDETLWWPEVDGWPCPPPALRGPDTPRADFLRTPISVIHVPNESQT